MTADTGLQQAFGCINSGLSLPAFFNQNVLFPSSGSCAYKFPSLRNLSILECTELKAFVLRLPAPNVQMMNEGAASFDEAPHSLFDEKVIFPKLEELCLTGIQSRELWKNEMPDEFICRLKVLKEMLVIETSMAAFQLSNRFCWSKGQIHKRKQQIVKAVNADQLKYLSFHLAKILCVYVPTCKIIVAHMRICKIPQIRREALALGIHSA
ncbi:hypothetical protein NL676_030703 [Syzygium grande]|nr:hypothetical protein NL676_030703 [Syzygium grande]